MYARDTESDPESMDKVVFHLKRTIAHHPQAMEDWVALDPFLIPCVRNSSTGSRTEPTNRTPIFLEIRPPKRQRAAWL